MSYNVHLHIVGKEDDSVFDTLRSGIKMDRLYLLDGDAGNNTEDRIVSRLKGIGFDEVTVMPIDQDDYASVFNTVTSISEKENSLHGDVLFHVDISSGHGVALAALSNASYSLNADLYYPKGGGYVTLELDTIDAVAFLKTKRIILETFRKFKKKDTYTNRELMGNLSSSRLTYRTRELSRLGLISKGGSWKEPVWSITPKGEQVLRRF